MAAAGTVADGLFPPAPEKNAPRRILPVAEPADQGDPLADHSGTVRASSPAQLRAWADQFRRENRGKAAVIADCQRRGWTVPRARDLAEEAVQEALTRTLTAYYENPERFDGYDHFRQARSGPFW